MIKKRKRKGKKRKRTNQSLNEEIVTIQPSEKKRKLDNQSTVSSKKKKKEIPAGEIGQAGSTNKVDSKSKQKKDAVKRDHTKDYHKNVRLASEVDFLDIGICKDFQRTGTCGYGLNCIYAHIREDYKSSFEISKEYEEQQRREERGEVSDDSDDESDDSDEVGHVPLTCSICSDEFKEPVVTKCHHFFCEKCIMKHYNFGKNPHCPVCGSPTDGIFNSAEDMVEKKKAKVELEKKKKEEEKENKKDERDFRMGWNY